MNNKFNIKKLKNENIVVLRSIKNINKVTFQKIVEENNPFLDYDFLLGLEETNCIGTYSGWSPVYIFYIENQEILGFLPVYLKSHSYGEYIFDWAWADFYSRNGVNFYPKLVVGVPFTPATGKRILMKNYDDNIFNSLIEALIMLGEQLQVSSINFLFLTEEEQNKLEKFGFMKRFTYQFHWKNNNYKNFDDFLAKFNSKKRNQLKRERKQANEGLEIEVLEGNLIKKEHLEIMFDLYTHTYSRKWGSPYLNLEFFYYLLDNLKENLLLVMVKKNNEYIAGTLNLKKGSHLYGRYWGAFEEQKCLHFEVCYYQAIEYCINNGFSLFEAGAQGDHKLARGFLPNYTYSSHYILDKSFKLAIEDFLIREKKSVDNTIKAYLEEAPFEK